MSKKWVVAEKIVFLIFVIANAYPVLAYTFFPTLDGAPHLYNSNCIKEMLLGNDFLHGFMQWNPFPNPNWTGHFIMTLGKFLLPGWMAEKIFLLIYLIGLPYGFRYLVKTLSPNNFAATYLIFPFSYTYMLFLGFYNFTISIVFLFFTLGFWLRSKDKLNPLRIAVLLLLVSATYFSHVSIYGLLFPMLFGLLFIDETSALLGGKIPLKIYFKAMALKTGALIIAFGITAWWTYRFLSPDRPESMHSFLPKEELLRDIQIVQPIIGFVQSEESRFTEKIFYVLIFLALAILVFRIIGLIRGFGFSRQIIKEKGKTLFEKGDLWLVFAMVFMVGYFVLPDSDNWAGYFSLRILLLCFLMFLVWISTRKIPNVVLILSVCVMLFFYVQVTIYRFNFTRDLNKTALQCYKASEYLRENTTLYPMNLSGNWLYGHFDKYLGIDKAVVILENNECNQNYFPLTWNKKGTPHMFLDATGAIDSCYGPSYNGSKNPLKADYIFITGQPDTNKVCEKKLYWFFKNNCKTAYTDGFVSLYEIN